VIFKSFREIYYFSFHTPLIDTLRHHYALRYFFAKC